MCVPFAFHISRLTAIPHARRGDQMEATKGISLKRVATRNNQRRYPKGNEGKRNGIEMCEEGAGEANGTQMGHKWNANKTNMERIWNASSFCGTKKERKWNANIKSIPHVFNI